ncbi:MAG: hypothetical protein IH857_07310 [Deltaproteobacteria bacterium]|nr:hypothetical protein [Deltaproteobacteria bacterium]MCZ6626423.1 hypothetical protein [Deltaproteobacteria bacterium]
MYDDFLARILEPDTFLPSQFYGNEGLPRHLEGERGLMLAILKDAVECLQKYREASSSSGKELYQNALEWVEDKSTGWLFTFTNICDLLGFDPDYLRKSLLKREYKTTKPTKGKVYPFPPLSSRG